MSRHTAELTEHLSFVRRQLALHRGASADKTHATRVLSADASRWRSAAAAAAERQGYKDALAALPFHLDATYLDASGQAVVTGRLAYLPFRGPPPLLGAAAVCDAYAYEPAFIRKRNERERHRVRCVNDGYARLREHLPRELEEKRLSKVETLRAAIDYIHQLQEVLERSASSSGVLVEMSPGDARKSPTRTACAAQRSATTKSQPPLFPSRR